MTDIASQSPSTTHDAVPAPHTAALAVVARGLQKTFDRTLVLRDLSLQVAAGEIFGLIGPSGSGKTTTTHLCCGHLRPTAGSVTVLGEQPLHFSAATRRRIGYLPQQFVLHPDLTVEQNVSFAAGLYGLPEWSARSRIREVLELVELWDARARPARAASGGMQRRLALAAALVHAPDLLFADEPTANLDPILRGKLWRSFRSAAAQGRTLMVTTQYIDEAEYCDRVGLMYGGALIAEGQPDALRRRAFGGDIIRLALTEPSAHAVAALAALPAVNATETLADGTLRITVERAERAIPLLIDAVEMSDARVQSIAQERATFDEVFIRLIEQHGEQRPAVGRLQTSAGDTLS